MSTHLLNPELIWLAQQAFQSKEAFVPSQGGGMVPPDGAPPGGAPPPGGPLGGGGAPPGADAGAFALPPSASGGGPDPLQQVLQKLDMMAQQGGGGGGGAGGKPLQPKIDVNVEIMQVKNMLAKICDALGVHIPAQDMVATPEKLTAMAQGQQSAGQAPPAGGVQPVQPLPPLPPAGGGKTAAVDREGVAFNTDGLTTHYNRAAAISAIITQRRHGRN